jgi:hypothetical protein
MRREINGRLSGLSCYRGIDFAAFIGNEAIIKTHQAALPFAL